LRAADFTMSRNNTFNKNASVELGIATVSDHSTAG